MFKITQRVKIAIEFAEPHWLLKRKLIDEFRLVSLIFINVLQLQKKSIIKVNWIRKSDTETSIS